MGDDRHFLTGVVNGLRHRLSEIQVLDQLHFEMVVGQVWADDIGTVRRARKLLATPGVITVGQEFVAPSALATFAFLAGVHALHTDLT